MMMQRTSAAATTAVRAVPSRGMATQKELKARVNSVNSIQRITKTMKMVAAAKLRGFQSQLEAERPIAAASKGLVDRVAAEETEDKFDGKHIHVIVSSDRGLCGGLNSSVAKFVKKDLDSSNGDDGLVFIGDKARVIMQRTHRELIQFHCTEAQKKPPNFLQASLIAEQIADLEYDRASIVFNRFKSVIANETVFFQSESSSAMSKRLSQFAETYEFEGEEGQVLKDYSDFLLANSVHNALLENTTSEQASRMTAMDGAAKNCGDMIKRLTLSMNKARQAQITKELCEIVAGAESISASK